MRKFSNLALSKDIKLCRYRNKLTLGSKGFIFQLILHQLPTFPGHVFHFFRELQIITLKIPEEVGNVSMKCRKLI